MRGLFLRCPTGVLSARWCGKECVWGCWGCLGRLWAVSLALRGRHPMSVWAAEQSGRVRAAGPCAPLFSELQPAHRAPAVQLLARAFRDSPLECRVIEGDAERRMRCNVYGMRALLLSATGTAHVLGAFPGGTSASPAAVLIATAPNRYPIPMPGFWQQLRCLFGQGLRVARRWAAVYQELEAVHPREPHWYLSLLGVDPRLQRKGYGSALLDHWLQRADRDTWPSYLETDRPENVAFYRRFGFSVTTEVQVLGIPVWCMARRSPNDENYGHGSDASRGR